MRRSACGVAPALGPSCCPLVRRRNPWRPSRPWRLWALFLQGYPPARTSVERKETTVHTQTSAASVLLKDDWPVQNRQAGVLPTDRHILNDGYRSKHFRHRPDCASGEGG